MAVAAAAAAAATGRVEQRFELEFLGSTRAAVAAAAPVGGAGVQQEYVHVRGADGGDGELCSGELAGARGIWVRA